MRLLHLADLHLDTPAPGRTERVRKRLRAAVRDALRTAVDVALAEEVDAVLVAGDLLDGQRLSFDSERYLLRELQRLGDAGIPVIYATGNHDAPDSGSRALQLPWPDNVVVVATPDPVRIPILDGGGDAVGFVTAAGHPTSRETRDLSARFPEPEPSELPEVALLHTQVRRAEWSDRHHAYAPSTLDGLLAKGYHCWALGHVHKGQVLNDAPLVLYPGNPQGRTFNETGVRGVYVLDLSAPLAPRVRFRATCSLRFEVLVASELSDCTSLDLLVGAVQEAWSSARTSDDGAGADWIVRVELSGPCPLASELSNREDVAVLEDELAAVLGALDVTVWTSAVHPVIEVGDYRGRDDVLGEALRLLLRVENGHEPLETIDPGELAGYSGTSSTEREAYLRTLFQGLSVDAIARMRMPE